MPPLLSYIRGLFPPLVRSSSASFCEVPIADMRFIGVANATSLLALAGFGYAQFPPTPEGVTVRDSKFGDGVQLSWKEVCLS